MYSLKQFRGKAEERGDLSTIYDDRRCDSPTWHEIDTWESEGGGSAVAVGEFDAARTALSDIADWRANSKAGWLPSRSDGNTFKNDDAHALVPANEDDRILRCLGAAVMMSWNTLPTKLQRELFDTASSVGELLQAGAPKGLIARFLHKHKDDDR